MQHIPVDNIFNLCEILSAGLFFSWHCILISLLGLLVLNNLFLIGGVICSKLIWMKAWTLAQLIVLIGQLHVIIVDLLVRKMYADCLMILLCSVWTVLFVLIVYKCIQYMEERQMNEAPLLPNEDL